MIIGKYSKRDKEEHALLVALKSGDVVQVRKILRPYRSLLGKLKLLLGARLDPCTTDVFRSAVSSGKLECVKMVAGGISAYWRGDALCSAAGAGNIRLLQWLDSAGDISDRDYELAISSAVRGGHVDCLRAVRHKWYVVDNPLALVIDAAEKGGEDMLRFILGEILPPKDKGEMISKALVALADRRKYWVVDFVAERFGELDNAVFDDVMSRFEWADMPRVRARLEKVALLKTTPEVRLSAAPRRI